MTETSQPRVSANLAATVNVDSKASQAVLVTGMGVSALTLICATILLTSANAAGWAMLVLCGLMFGGTLIAWRKAQSDTDLAGSHPTTIVRSDGVSLSTDSRTIRNVDAMQGVLQLLQMRPLPEPDAIIDASGNVVPNSQHQAVTLVDQINEGVEEAATQLADTVIQSQSQNFAPPSVPGQPLPVTQAPNQATQ